MDAGRSVVAARVGESKILSVEIFRFGSRINQAGQGCTRCIYNVSRNPRSFCIAGQRLELKISFDAATARRCQRAETPMPSSNGSLLQVSMFLHQLHRFNCLICLTIGICVHMDKLEKGEWSGLPFP